MKTLLILNDAPFGSERTYNGAPHEAFIEALTAEIPAQPADMARIMNANLRGAMPEPVLA
jgi:hypothetical protein